MRALLLIACAFSTRLVTAFYTDDTVPSITPANIKAVIKPNSVCAMVRTLSTAQARMVRRILCHGGAAGAEPMLGPVRTPASPREKAAKALKGIMGVAAINADEHKQLAGEYNIQGFPTIKLLQADAKGKISVVADYQGGRTAAALIEWGLSQAKKVALKRIGASASSGGGGSRGGHAGGGGGDGGFYVGTDVVTLTDRNFESEVMDSEDMWFVEFYAPWCGHCKNLKPAWIDAASQLKDKVKVGAVDCTAEQATCQQFGVQGYPTIKWFGLNKQRPEAYNGGRDSDAIVGFAVQQWAKHAPPPEVRELVDQEAFVEHCLGQKGDKSLGLEAVPAKKLCFIAFLPHILDAKKAGRNADIKVLKGIADKYKDRPFSYFWAQGGEQSALESNLGVGGYGYPALIAYNPDHQRYASHRYTFDAKHVKEFVEGVQKGFERLVPISGNLAEVQHVTPWDGEDAEEPMEEEFSLDDLFGDDEASGAADSGLCTSPEDSCADKSEL